jgi:hypothetical protein
MRSIIHRVPEWLVLSVSQRQILETGLARQLDHRPPFLVAQPSWRPSVAEGVPVEVSVPGEDKVAALEDLNEGAILGEGLSEVPCQGGGLRGIRTVPPARFVLAQDKLVPTRI